MPLPSGIGSGKFARLVVGTTVSIEPPRESMRASEGSPFSTVPLLWMK